MCSEPVMRAPVSGWLSPNSARRAMRPGISSSASSISLRPQGARERSATLKSLIRAWSVAWFLRVVRAEAGALLVWQVGWVPAGTTLISPGPTRVAGRAPAYGAGAALRSSSTGMGPGSTPAWAARWRLTKSPWMHEVEELGEGALALGLARRGPRATTSSTIVVDEVEAAGDLRVLEVVAELDEREHLAGDVAVLAPAADLVVAQLGARRSQNAGALAFSLTWLFQR